MPLPLTSALAIGFEFRRRRNARPRVTTTIVLRNMEFPRISLSALNAPRSTYMTAQKPRAFYFIAHASLNASPLATPFPLPIFLLAPLVFFHPTHVEILDIFGIPRWRYRPIFPDQERIATHDVIVSARPVWWLSYSLNLSPYPSLVAISELAHLLGPLSSYLVSRLQAFFPSYTPSASIRRTRPNSPC